jgi:hypothetical protein
MFSIPPSIHILYSAASAPASPVTQVPSPIYILYSAASASASPVGSLTAFSPFPLDAPQPSNLGSLAASIDGLTQSILTQSILTQSNPEIE